MFWFDIDHNLISGTDGIIVEAMAVFDAIGGWVAQLGDQAGDIGEATGGGESAATEDGPAPNNMSSNLMMWLPIMLGMMVLYMFLMAKPQKKEQAARKELLDNLKKNDRVLTAGGLQGIVTSVGTDNEYVTLRIDESNNTKIKILRTSIAKVITDDDGKGTSEDK